MVPFDTAHRDKFAYVNIKLALTDRRENISYYSEENVFNWSMELCFCVNKNKTAILVIYLFKPVCVGDCVGYTNDDRKCFYNDLWYAITPKNNKHAKWERFQ